MISVAGNLGEFDRTVKNIPLYLWGEIPLRDAGGDASSPYPLILPGPAQRLRNYVTVISIILVMMTMMMIFKRRSQSKTYN